MSMLEKHLKELAELAVSEPKTALSVQEVIDILLDIKTDSTQNEFPIDGDELAKYFRRNNKTPVPMSQHGINEGLA
jgi:hypothetical protein